MKISGCKVLLIVINCLQRKHLQNTEYCSKRKTAHSSNSKTVLRKRLEQRMPPSTGELKAVRVLSLKDRDNGKAVL